MIISSRLSRILQICLQNDTFITADEFAHKLQISRRTIFRELSDVNDYLQKNFNLTLNSKANKGFKIEGEQEDKDRLEQTLQVTRIDYVNKEERRNLLIFEILREKEYQKLYYYANEFQVSESTISNDLDEIEPWFQQYGLHIVRTPGLGICLEGKESDYRRALMRIISKSIQENDGYDKINPQDALYLLEKIFLNDQEGIMKLLNQNILKCVLYVFDEHYHELSLDKYAQSSYIGLIIHLTIMIERIKQQESMEPNEEVVAMMKASNSFEKAMQMGGYLEKEFDIEIPEAEIAFIAMHIQGAKVNAIDMDDELAIIDEDNLSNTVDTMIAYFDEHYPYHLYLDEELRCGLFVHLKPAFIRLQHQMNIYNPLLQQIKQDYEDIFQHSKKVCQQCFSQDIPEDEVGYIAMHFGAAIERSKQNDDTKRIVKVGIVCSSGIGVSAMLLARIKKVVDNNVKLKTYSVQEAKQNTEQCELFISTFDFPCEKPILVVDPLFDKEDVKNIKEQIHKMRQKVVLYKENEETQNVVQGLAEDIFQLLDQFELYDCQEELDEISVLEKIAKMFSGKDIILEKEILTALIEREKHCSSIFSEFQFAIFHTTLKNINSCVFKVLKSSTNSFTKQLSNIRFIIVMFMPKNSTTQQKQMMSSINQTLVENELVYDTFKEGNQEEIKMICENIMKDFLFETLKESRENR